MRKLLKKDENGNYVNVHGRMWLIREVAKRAKFTLNDTTCLINTFIEVMKESIKNKAPFIIPGLFRMTITVFKSDIKYSPLVKNVREGKKYKIVFKPSHHLYQLLRDDIITEEFEAISDDEEFEEDVLLEEEEVSEETNLNDE